MLPYNQSVRTEGVQLICAYMLFMCEQDAYCFRIVVIAKSRVDYYITVADA